MGRYCSGSKINSVCLKKVAFFIFNLSCHCWFSSTLGFFYFSGGSVGNDITFLIIFPINSFN